ncbi:hypothetical protein [Flectobacillus major]|jgi:hypothetical protein|uniref:hypothetical protein n=1 Tax=Flectobacillus major TaxID=103 RepID=UPI000400C655|nr:hypothetical protein [Flectobacillus major]
MLTLIISISIVAVILLIIFTLVNIQVTITGLEKIGNPLRERIAQYKNRYEKQKTSS